MYHVNNLFKLLFSFSRNMNQPCMSFTLVSFTSHRMYVTFFLCVVVVVVVVTPIIFITISIPFVVLFGV